MYQVGTPGNGLEMFLTIWPRPLKSEIAGKDREKYEKREKAIEMYCRSSSMKDIEAATGIKRAQVKKLFKRCLERDDTGNYLGFSALLPYLHVKRRNEARENSIRYLLIIKESELGKRVLSYYFNDKSSGPNKHCSKRDAFHYMHLELNKMGYSDDMYPKTLKDKGYKSFCRFLDEVAKSSPGTALARSTDDQRRLFSSTGTINPVRPGPQRPYEELQIDGHLVDAFYYSQTVSPDGKAGITFCYRSWLLTAVDAYSGVIVGHRIVFDAEYDQYDILKLFESVIKPTGDIKGIRPDGFASQVFEEARWVMPSVIKLDNAMAHLAKSVIQQTYELGLNLEFGPVADPVKRPLVERAYGSLETLFIRKLPSACGRNPSDLIKKGAQDDALKYGIDEKYMEHYLTASIAEYNNTIMEDYGRTPIGRMREAFRKGLVPTKLPHDVRVLFYVPVYKEVTVRGNRLEGRRPYVQFLNHRYTSDVLADGYDLTHAKLVIRINPDDLTTVDAFLKDNGKSLGPLYMKGANKYNIEKLSMRSIRKINAANKELKYDEMTKETNIDTALALLEEGKKTTKKQKRAADTIRKDLGPGYRTAKVEEKDDIYDIRKAREKISEEFEAYGYDEDELSDIVSDLI